MCACVFAILTAQDTSCDGCIDATICTVTTGRYLLQFSKLFDQSNSPCEILYLDGRPVPNATLMEGECTELPPNFNYSILCPICPQSRYEIYYTILPSNIEDCSYGKYLYAISASTCLYLMTMTTNDLIIYIYRYL